MDVIDKAIERNWHMAEDEWISQQTWEVFEERIAERPLLLFGAGDGIDSFFDRYSDKIKMQGVIDNEVALQGIRLGDMVLPDIPSELAEIKIGGRDLLKQYKPDEVTILVMALKRYAEIIAWLKDEGYSDCFAFLVMEAKRRIALGETQSVEYQKKYIERCCKMTVKSDKLVFYTMGNFSGHGKQIALQLLKLNPNLDIVWIVRELTEHVEGIRFVLKGNKKQFIYEMETAKFWVFDDMIPMFLYKREEQIYIQIKHWASITLKTFGFDLARFRNEPSGLELYAYNRDRMDYIITGSTFDTETCRKGFEFEGTVFEAGSPRSDILFRGDDYYAKICDEYHLERGKNLLLYAPTFRCKRGISYQPDQGEITLDFDRVKEALEQKFGGTWIILLRLHPIVSHKADEMSFPEYVVNVSSYNDSEELVAASDVLITDYSSIMFEPAFVKKPVFLFATDREEYIDGERGLLIAYDELPFPISESNEELTKQISEFDQENYERTLAAFFEKYGVHEDGHASERAAQFILDLVDGKVV